MALKYKLDATAYDELDDLGKANYKKEGNIYILDVEGLDSGDDLAGLKAKNEQLITEKREALRQKQEVEDAAKAKSDDKAKKDGDFEQLYKSQQAENERLTSELGEIRSSVTKQTVNAEASRVAASLTKDTARAGLLAEKIAGRLKFTDEGIKVLDASGSLTVSSIEDLATSIKADFPFLVDGSQSSGGAALGSKGGAGGSQKQATRSEFDAMDQAARSTFARSDGVVIDD